MPSVLLVDDVESVRTVIRAAMRIRGGFELLAEAATGEEAVQCAQELQPDLVVLDLGLPDLAGHEVLHRIRIASPESRIVVFTGNHGTEEGIVRSTADAFLGKDSDVDYLLDLLEQQFEATTTLTATIEVAPDRTEIRRVRRFVEDCCREWSCEDRIDDALLVVSELATNAAVHAGTTYLVTVRRRLGALRLDVFDGSEDAPELRGPDRDSEGGRGLYLVSAMSAAWGVEKRLGGGKLVWADLLCESQVGASAS
ncbi:MAG TPA: response regulator [Acidimicrobiales bacterium]|nr:response regulator [Acidimicrobiales bacterium]